LLRCLGDEKNVSGCWILSTGRWVLGTGYWVLGAGWFVIVTGLSKKTKSQNPEPSTQNLIINSQKDELF